MQKTLIAITAALFMLSGCQEKEQSSKPKEQPKKEQPQKQQKQSEPKQPQQDTKVLQQDESSLEQSKEATQQTPVDESDVPMEKDGVAQKQENTQQQDSAPSTEKSGKELYVSCVSCHGSNAERKALGASEVIAGWDKQKLIDSMQGYKDGSYGGNMKATMTAQMARFDKDQVEKLAEYISTL
ncbi:MAG: c-type cytochrome [Campylobacterota bacterium]